MNFSVQEHAFMGGPTLARRDVAGLFALAARWFATVHALHPTEARCPSFGFDTLYTGGVSSHGP